MKIEDIVEQPEPKPHPKTEVGKTNNQTNQQVLMQIEHIASSIRKFKPKHGNSVPLTLAYKCKQQRCSTPK